jgi:hypothetical protein
MPLHSKYLTQGWAGEGWLLNACKGMSGHCSSHGTHRCMSQYWRTPVAGFAALKGVLVGAVAVPAAEAVKSGAVFGVAGAGLGQVGEARGQLGVVGL